MNIEVGKLYRTRDGRKAAPMRTLIGEPRCVAGTVDGDRKERVWASDGRHDFSSHNIDLVAEWSDGPVRTVTRKEIVPGAYGNVAISGGDAPSGGFVLLSLLRTAFNARELRALAATLTELADALEQP